jgi:farnesyl-diphosphate farnesyltransferase
MGQSASELLHGLLRDVSRSFYLTLRVLPGTIRSQIGLAYLLARATDTIADTDAVPKEERLAVLARVGERIGRGGGSPLPLNILAGHQSSVAERVLLQRLEEALALVEQLAPDDQERVRDVLRIIISGQSLDLQRFSASQVDRIVALKEEAELDDYIYRVAGCVGEFWTKMCRAHAFPTAKLDDAFLLANGVRFGKGLQLVNILRDLPRDLRSGRCYLPAASLASVGLQPGDLLQPQNEGRLRPVYLQYLQLADGHLKAGWAYTNHLPRRAVRIRLACAWPILIGAKTLAKLREGRVLDPEHRIKVSRREVRQVLLRSILAYPCAGAWHRLLARFGAASPTSPRRKPLLEPASLAK